MKEIHWIKNSYNSNSCVQNFSQSRDYAFRITEVLRCSETNCITKAIPSFYYITYGESYRGLRDVKCGNKPVEPGNRYDLRKVMCYEKEKPVIKEDYFTKETQPQLAVSANRVNSCDYIGLKDVRWLQ